MGGLTVWRALRAALPGESLLYLGDGKNCPYGSKPREEVRRLADEAVAALVAVAVVHHLEVVHIEEEDAQRAGAAAEALDVA